MLFLTCPHCGRRSVEEFRYAEIPTVPKTVTDPEAIDLDRGFYRTNLAGVVIERWFHEYGCRRWITISRDTRTDQVV